MKVPGHGAPGVQGHLWRGPSGCKGSRTLGPSSSLLPPLLAPPEPPSLGPGALNPPGQMSRHGGLSSVGLYWLERTCRGGGLGGLGWGHSPVPPWGHQHELGAVLWPAGGWRGNSDPSCPETGLVVTNCMSPSHLRGGEERLERREEKVAQEVMMRPRREEGKVKRRR